jgi:hypothetical protein
MSWQPAEQQIKQQNMTLYTGESHSDGCIILCCVECHDTQQNKNYNMTLVAFDRVSLLKVEFCWMSRRSLDKTKSF